MGGCSRRTAAGHELLMPAGAAQRGSGTGGTWGWLAAVIGISGREGGHPDRFGIPHLFEQGIEVGVVDRPQHRRVQLGSVSGQRLEGRKARLETTAKGE